MCILGTRQGRREENELGVLYLVRMDKAAKEANIVSVHNTFLSRQ